jgi:NADH-quinone oxidoreductase subunit M
MHGPPRGVLVVEDDGAPKDGPAPDAPADGGGATAVLTAPARTRTLRVGDLSRREIAVVTPLVALIIGLGFYPQPLIDLVTPAVQATISDVGSDPGGHTPAATDGEND